MRLNSKVTWGLAWTGLAVVLAVPSADFLTGKLNNKAAVITSTTDPVKTGTDVSAPVPATKTAAVTMTTTKTGVTITPAGGNTPSATDPVDKFLKTNKALPNYISGDTSQTASTTTPKTTDDAVQVATVAPTPFPSRPPDVVSPVLPEPTTKPALTVTTDPMVTSAIPKSTAPVIAPKVTAPADPVVIVEEPAAPTQEAALDEPDHPVPPAPIIDESATWRAKGLGRYLENNNLLSDGESSASVHVIKRPSRTYDSDGFYLSDGPNNSRAERRARILRMLEDSDEYQGDEEDPGFTLF